MWCARADSIIFRPRPRFKKFPNVIFLPLPEKKETNLMSRPPIGSKLNAPFQFAICGCGDEPPLVSIDSD
jgi:hypothetical protein